MRTILILIMTSFFISCSVDNNSDYFTLNKKNITITMSSLDTVKVSPMTFSGVGFWDNVGGKPHFFDEIFSTVLTFDTVGNQINMSLGEGEGPKETIKLNQYHYGSVGNVILSNFTISIYNDDWSLIERSSINWNSDNIAFATLRDDPQPHFTGIYEINWRGSGNNGLVHETPDGHILASISSSHPLFNGYMNEEYYQRSSILAKINPETGEVVQIGGKRGDAYLEHKFIPNFDFMSYDLSKDKIFVTYGPDPQIYVFDMELNFLGKFGRFPEDMRDDYRTTQTYDEAEANWLNDWNEFGFNDWIYYDSVYDRILRTVKPEGLNGSSIVQVYNAEFVLISEFTAPKRFRVFGQKGDHYFADGLIEEDNEELGYYTFNLKKYAD